MELRTLRAFVEVVRKGGFSQAAKTLAQRDDLLRELDELRWLKKGSLRLGIPAFSAGVLIAPMFAAYRKQFPGIEVVITETGSARQEEMLGADEIDLAALLFPAKAEFEWDEQDIVEIRFVAVLSKRHPLVRRASIQAIDLKDQPLLMLPEDAVASSSMQQIWDSLGFEPKIIARSGQLHFLIMLAEQGVGIALMPELSFELLKSSSAVSAIPIEHPGAVWRLVFAWRKGGYLSHAARAWLALSREIRRPVKA